jgi:uncharacterized membrane protein YdjX (TVP38/TMEM64 family)
MNQASTVSPAQRVTALVNRFASLIKWVSISLIVVSIFLIVRQVPVGPALDALECWIKGLGFWGPVVFGLIYVVAVVLLVPASTLTLVAGAVFGLWVALITVSLASTTGAALAFVISRYLARDRVAQLVKQYPKFDAIDRAITEGGWRIVALLRLSPAVPFNLQNYLYGLTGIRFWTAVLTSWVAMLPGTFMYVYLGYAGRAAVEASSEEHSRSPGEWALIGVGLLATIVVTVYVTRLARRALREHTALGQEGETAELKSSAVPGPKGWPWGTTITAVAALAMLAAAVYLQFNPEFMEQWF